MSNKTIPIKKLSDMLLTSVFVISLFIPVIVTISSPEKTMSLTENRKLVKFPTFRFSFSSLQSYPDRFQNYFNDHFGMRDTLVFLHHYISVALLKKSPVDSVIIGQNDWLFWKIPAFGRNRPSPDQLQAMKMHLETKQKWLARQGIKYIFLPVPETRSIYPEYLPPNLRSAETDHQLNDLIQYLGKNSPVTILDVRTPLQNAKKENQLYHRTDHHWNDLGAYIAYREVMNTLQSWFPQIRPIESNQLEQQVVPSVSMSLANMLGLSSVLTETVTKLSPAHTCSTERPYAAMLPDWNQKANSEDEKEWYQLRIPVYTVCPGKQLKAIVFRDSFFQMMIPFFSAHFQEAVYIWTKFDYSILPDLIRQVQPDVVIEECTESEIFLYHIPGMFHKTKGLDLLVSGDKEAAIQEFRKDLQVNPNSPDSYNNLGFAMLQTRDFDKAVFLFQAALKLDKNNKKASENLSMAQNAVAEMDKKISEIRALLSENPNDPELYVRLGNLFRKRGKPAMAVSCYQNALTLYPEHFTALRSLAALHAGQKHYAEAVKLYQKIAQVYPKKPETYYNLACLYSLENNVPLAIANLKTAIQHGYKNFDLLAVDDDLKNIRNTEFFTGLLKQEKPKGTVQ